MKTNNKTLNKPVTDHAKQRITERTDIPLSNAKRISDHVFKNGYKLRVFTGDLYDYLCSKRIDGGHYDIRVWEDYIYIYDTQQKRLLTVYPIPTEFLPISDYFNRSSSPSIIWVRGFGTSQYVCEGDMLTDDIGLAVEFRTVQKAKNYIKNNRTLAVLVKQGYDIIIL